MDLALPLEVARDYTSGSQRIRVITESWVTNLIFCPSCGSSLRSFAHNRPVADFYCGQCSEEYELKAKQGAVGKRIVDGAYSTMIERLTAENNPHFFLLSYDRTTYGVMNFLAIPKYFFVPNIVEERKPLSATARRAGWIGCNIVVSGIPELGRIFYVQNGVPQSKNAVLAKWSKTEFVRRTHDIEAKGWLLDVLTCVERIGRAEFSLEEVYGFEAYLKARHPSNHNIRAKIRQQLQLLRDKNVIDFVGHGKYGLTNGAA